MSSAGPRRWPGRARRGLSLVALSLVMACAPAPDRPAGLSGEWLVDLGSVDCGVRPLLSSSADGRWLAFWLSYFRPDAGLTLPMRSPALFDESRGTLHLPAGSAERVTGPSFDPVSLCWDDPNQRIFVRASRQSGLSPGRWFSAALDIDAELGPSGPPPGHCRQPAPQQWEWNRPQTERPELRRGLNIARKGCCELVLSTSNGNVLATHEAQREFSDPLLVTRFAWSGEARFLAYTLSEQVSWRFALPSPSYVVAQGQATKRLEGQIFALGWHGDDALLGCAARDASSGGGNGLKQWRFDVD